MKRNVNVDIYMPSPNDPSSNILVGSVNVEINGNDAAVQAFLNDLNDTYGENNVN